MKELTGILYILVEIAILPAVSPEEQHNTVQCQLSVIFSQVLPDQSLLTGTEVDLNHFQTGNSAGLLALVLD